MFRERKPRVAKPKVVEPKVEESIEEEPKIDFSKIFEGSTVSEAKALYTKMCLIHHPDKGGDAGKFC